MHCAAIGVLEVETWGNVTGTSGRLRELKIRSGEVIAQAKQWLACKLGYGVGHAVAEVQSRTVPALAEGNKRVGRDRPVIGRELRDLDLGLLQEPREQRLAGMSEPRTQHQRTLNDGRCPDAGVLGSRQEVPDALVARFLEQDRDDRRAVDNHTPSRP